MIYIILKKRTGKYNMMITWSVTFGVSSIESLTTELFISKWNIAAKNKMKIQWQLQYSLKQ